MKLKFSGFKNGYIYTEPNNFLPADCVVKQDVELM